MYMYMFRHVRCLSELVRKLVLLLLKVDQDFNSREDIDKENEPVSNSVS